MKEPSFQITTILSFVIHITFLCAAFIIIKQTNHFVMPSSYVVSLVGPEIEESAVATPESTTKEISEYPAVPKKIAPLHENAEQYASNRIAALEATRKAKRIVRLRNIISLRGSATSEENATEISQPAEGEGEATILTGYYAKIKGEIWQQWVFPETDSKNLEAIISIIVMHDGTVKINRIEKSSGNLLFDRSALKAISKASPVSPPPYEMEIGLRFTP